jgi:carboxyl-terminal processing protease
MTPEVTTVSKPLMSRALIAGAILGAGLVSGGLMIQNGSVREAGAVASSEPATPRLLEQVMARIGRDFIDTLTTDDMLRRAATGFVKEIDDPYSVLLTPDRLRRVRESTSGRYPGVGIEIDLRDGFVTVVAPLRGTPADSAGIKPGDRVLSIDGKTTLGLTMEEVQQALRGPAGSVVTLALDRDGAHPVVKLTRREIVFHPVQRAQNLLGGVGYVELATFSLQAAGEVRRAVDSLRAAGARSLILDLRENPGGLLEQGIAVADLFLDADKVIASTRGRTPDADHEFRDAAAQRWPGLPIVVLVDSGTASAAEIAAGALQDNERAVLVGSATYGKGSAQSIFPVVGGHGLKLTTARWFTPSGRTIERDTTDKGAITPDVVIDTKADRATAYDPVMKRALELLRDVRTPEELRRRVPVPKPR